MDRGLPDRARLRFECLFFSHLDFHRANILVPEYGAICIIDWDMSGIYLLVLKNMGSFTNTTADLPSDLG